MNLRPPGPQPERSRRIRADSAVYSGLSCSELPSVALNLDPGLDPVRRPTSPHRTGSRSGGPANVTTRHQDGAFRWSGGNMPIATGIPVDPSKYKGTTYTFGQATDLGLLGVRARESVRPATRDRGAHMAATAPQAGTITSREAEQVERANASGKTPVVFIHGLWLLPSSWDQLGRAVRAGRLCGGHAVVARRSGDDRGSAGASRGLRRQDARPDRRPRRRGDRGARRRSRS